MDILVVLIPVSLGLGTLGLLAFLWTLRHGQYDDPAGDAARILTDDNDAAPADQPRHPAPMHRVASGSFNAAVMVVLPGKSR